MKGFVVNNILINMYKVLYMNYDRKERTLEVNFGESSITILNVGDDIYYQMKESFKN